MVVSLTNAVNPSWRTNGHGTGVFRAALELGMSRVPVIDAPLGTDSAIVYMLKAAVLRRHLTEDQQSMIAARWKDANKAPTGAAAHGKSPRHRGDLDTHPTTTKATELYDVGVSVLPSQNY